MTAKLTGILWRAALLAALFFRPFSAGERVQSAKDLRGNDNA